MNGQALYTPPEVQAQITHAGINAGQRFQIEKRKNGREFEWIITAGQPVAVILEGQPSLDSPVEEIPHSRLEDALRNAVSAAAAAEKHGAAIGYPVRFKPEDVRAMAISVLIGMDRRAA